MKWVFLGGVLALSTMSAEAKISPMTPDVPDKPALMTLDNADYTRREQMIPMRDGVKLYTVILIPKGAMGVPIMLTRTPYNAARRAERMRSASLLSTLPQGDDIFVEAGYIRVFQDVRGKYRSEGDYVLTRPSRGALNFTSIDHATDAWDTIDWLVHNLPETNGRVGMIGSSYEGFTVVTALLDPHPALKAAVPESPMVDGWMGDDWFHYGAFRQRTFDFIASDTSARAEGRSIARATIDDYENFLRAGSAAGFAKAAGLESYPYWQKISQHPAYDEFWQAQALDHLLDGKRLEVPTLWEQGLWDQEDIWGAIHAYAICEGQDRTNDRNYLVLGPWRHSQANYTGQALGPLNWEGDTAFQFRHEVLRPFFDRFLQTLPSRAEIPPVLVYNTGENHWDRFKSWPPKDDGWKPAMRPIYLREHGRLSFDGPAAREEAFDDYVADPAKPVPYVPRPILFSDGELWRRWLVADQRPYTDRTDVLTYVTEPLTVPVRISGSPMVNLVASTSGTDSDWVVKLIDVYPDEFPNQPELSGYELAIGMDIFRGRYRESFEHPKPLTPNAPLTYRFALPPANHVFQPGHRIMVQIQSSWFPLYDRNPQTYVDNIFFAKPADYMKATQRVYHEPDRARATTIELPILEKAN